MFSNINHQLINACKQANKISFSWDLEIYYLLLRHNNIYITYKVIYPY
ncbi:hypothetical protein BACCELL_03764 [Bacteroides cellulosilyticus DSM 14838]|uniref:Uncharacterized protein n=1 Tax=Bacteroides cellulosilyticus DSM 14838 TaxID=537012 RepID=E2NHI7_9BACE|nr:hypothetical protein BACCELL_03764 [Bacteroides cellulosilyticus DSM 14838]